MNTSQANGGNNYTWRGTNYNNDATIILGSFAVRYSDNLTILSFLRHPIICLVCRLIINQGVRHGAFSTEALSHALYEIALSWWKQSYVFYFRDDRSEVCEFIRTYINRICNHK